MYLSVILAGLKCVCVCHLLTPPLALHESNRSLACSKRFKKNLQDPGTNLLENCYVYVFFHKFLWSKLPDKGTNMMRPFWSTCHPSSKSQWAIHQNNLPMRDHHGVHRWRRCCQSCNKAIEMMSSQLVHFKASRNTSIYHILQYLFPGACMAYVMVKHIQQIHYMIIWTNLTHARTVYG